jgi:hypothetical protein
VTSVGDRAWCARVFDPFDPWVKERKQPVEVTAAAAGKNRLHDLDVLLRHRPRSISLAGDGSVGLAVVATGAQTLAHAAALGLLPDVLRRATATTLSVSQPSRIRSPHAVI